MNDDVSVVGIQCEVCGRRVTPGYAFCVGCERKRSKVMNDCVAAGMRVDRARGRVDEVYPRKYRLGGLCACE